MAKMPPDIGQEAWEAVTAARRFEHRVLQDLHLHKPHASQAPAGKPVTVGTTTAKENHMSALSDKLHGIATTVEHVEEEDLPKLAAVLANPGTADVFTILHQVSGLDLAPILAAVKTLLQPYVPAA